MTGPLWSTEFGDGPLVACALHDGHELRPEVAAVMRLGASQRLYEEDPYSGRWTVIAPTRIVARRSRFEFDLNRPREGAVYLTQEHAWGLNVWRSPPPPELVERSLAAYDDFYAHLRWLLKRLVNRHGRVVVFDLHSYNHARDGSGRKFADPRENPEINLGTATMDRALWAPVVERFLAELRGYDYDGRHLDVRENVKFYGGYFPRWIHENFPGQVCVLAIEVKKFFMDEWSGRLNEAAHTLIGKALRQAAAGVADALESWHNGPRRA